MKKIFALILVLIMCASLFACDEELIAPGDCEHSFKRKEVSELYLKSAATCQSPAVYYYCCEKCTAQGEETYEYGDKAPHSYEKTVLDKYKRTDATATDAATYYYSCKCGDKSRSYFFYGAPISNGAGNNGGANAGEWTACDKTVYALTTGDGYNTPDERYIGVLFNIGNAFHAIATNGVHYQVEGTVFADGKGYVRCSEMTDDADLITFINYPDDINTPDGGIKDVYKGLRLYKDITGRSVLSPLRQDILRLRL